MLVDNLGPSEMRAFIGETCGDRIILDRWLASSTVRAFELGRMDAGEFARRMVTEWRLRVTPDQFIARFRTWPRGLYPGVRELLRDLRGRFRLACLSNTNELHWPAHQEYVDLFEHAFASHELGMIKPDAEVYQHVTRVLGVDAGEIVFLDDSPVNVSAARAAGLQAHEVSGPSGLRPVLGRLGLVPEAGPGVA